MTVKTKRNFEKDKRLSILQIKLLGILFAQKNKSRVSHEVVSRRLGVTLQRYFELLNELNRLGYVVFVNETGRDGEEIGLMNVYDLNETNLYSLRNRREFILESGWTIRREIQRSSKTYKTHGRRRIYREC